MTREELMADYAAFLKKESDRYFSAAGELAKQLKHYRKMAWQYQEKALRLFAELAKEGK